MASPASTTDWRIRCSLQNRSVESLRRVSPSGSRYWWEELTISSSRLVTSVQIETITPFPTATCRRESRAFHRLHGRSVGSYAWNASRPHGTSARRRARSFLHSSPCTRNCETRPVISARRKSAFGRRPHGAANPRHASGSGLDCAAARAAAEGSIPVTVCPAAARRNASRPVPQPASSTQLEVSRRLMPRSSR